MTAELNIDKFEDFIAQYPIFEYRILNTGDLSVEERVRSVSRNVNGMDRPGHVRRLWVL